MARAPTTQDSFTAVAEPKRRRMLETLAAGELPVSELVELLGWPQPMVSKHLGVLKRVGLVRERREGRLRLYRVNVEQLRPIQDWVETLERAWTGRLDRLDTYLQQMQDKEQDDDRTVHN